MANGITIGQMRETVTFLANAPTTNETVRRKVVTTGGKNDNYSILLVTRGKLRKQSGNRQLSFGLVEEGERYELICRFQSTLEANLRIDTKIVIGPKTYTPNSWELIDQLNHFYKFVLNASSEQIDPADYPGLGIGTFVVS